MAWLTSTDEHQSRQCESDECIHGVPETQVCRMCRVEAYLNLREARQAHKRAQQQRIEPQSEAMRKEQERA